jgi:hypothetical protein
MGFIRSQADLIAAIAASKKLSATQKHHAYEAVVTQNHCAAATEIWEELLAGCDEGKLESRLAGELDGFYFWAAYLNRILKGTGIKWDGSDVGTKKWLQENPGCISDEDLADLEPAKRTSGRTRREQSLPPPMHSIDQRSSESRKRAK